METGTILSKTIIQVHTHAVCVTHVKFILATDYFAPSSFGRLRLSSDPSAFSHDRFICVAETSQNVK